MVGLNFSICKKRNKILSFSWWWALSIGMSEVLYFILKINID